MCPLKPSLARYLLDSGVCAGDNIEMKSEHWTQAALAVNCSVPGDSGIILSLPRKLRPINSIPGTPLGPKTSNPPCLFKTQESTLDHQWSTHEVSGGDVVPLGQFDGIATVVDRHDPRVVVGLVAMAAHMTSQRRVRYVRRWYRRSADEILVPHVLRAATWRMKRTWTSWTEAARFGALWPRRRCWRNVVAYRVTEWILPRWIYIVIYVTPSKRKIFNQTRITRRNYSNYTTLLNNSSWTSLKL